MPEVRLLPTYTWLLCQLYTDKLFGLADFKLYFEKLLHFRIPKNVTPCFDFKSKCFKFFQNSKIFNFLGIKFEIHHCPSNMGNLKPTKFLSLGIIHFYFSHISLLWFFICIKWEKGFWMMAAPLVSSLKKWIFKRTKTESVISYFLLA